MSARDDRQAPDRDEQAASWCVAFAEGGLHPDEQAEFDAWIADPANAQALDEAVQLWNVTAELGETPELIHFRASALESLRRSNGRRWAPRVSVHWKWAGGIAAMLALVLVTTLLLRVPSADYRTAIGERRIAMLADGSKLSLDGDSAVQVRLLEDRRELTLLRGRAKFDVAKDPLRPFAVAVGGRIVVATGTSFSVEMRHEQMRVVLYEGQVAVLDEAGGRPALQRGSGAAADGAPEMRLTPGHELVASLGTSRDATVRSTDPVRSLAWEAGQLSFDDEPISSAVAQVNRYSADRLVIADARIADVRVSGLFTAGDTRAFIDGVSALSPVRAQKQGTEIFLRHR